MLTMSETELKEKEITEYTDKKQEKGKKVHDYDQFLVYMWLNVI